MSVKCPACGEVVESAKIEVLPVTMSGRESQIAVYACKGCDYHLGMVPDSALERMKKG